MRADSNPRSRNLISLKRIAKRLDCSVATARRRSKADPNFPPLFNVNNTLFAYDDQVDAYIEALPSEAEKPVKFQRRREDYSAEASEAK
jgi:hypothetical protein